MIGSELHREQSHDEELASVGNPINGARKFFFPFDLLKFHFFQFIVCEKSRPLKGVATPSPGGDGLANETKSGGIFPRLAAQILNTHGEIDQVAVRSEMVLTSNAQPTWCFVAESKGVVLALADRHRGFAICHIRGQVQRCHRAIHKIECQRQMLDLFRLDQFLPRRILLYGFPVVLKNKTPKPRAGLRKHRTVERGFYRYIPSCVSSRSWERGCCGCGSFTCGGFGNWRFWLVRFGWGRGWLLNRW